MDNPKKKKMDGKRMSMQRHEIAYCRRLAKKILGVKFELAFLSKREKIKGEYKGSYLTISILKESTLKKMIIAFLKVDDEMRKIRKRSIIIGKKISKLERQVLLNLKAKDEKVLNPMVDIRRLPRKK